MDVATLGYEIDPSGLRQGVGEMKRVTAEAGKTEAAFARYGKKVESVALSQKQLAMANRQLPMQFTDIAVSVQSGQRPLQVLLQQGAQIKDMYGGVGPALKAAGGYILGLVNPATLSAAAVLGLVAAFKAAEDNQFAVAKALITTGGYAGMTAAEIERLVGTMADLEGVSYGVARRALVEVAQSGEFAGEQFKQVAQVAARMEVATGQAITDTIDKFREIEKDPVEALLKLNSTEHFLTRAQLDRVQALVEEQREQEAAAYGATIYADRLNDVADAADAAKPHLSQMWQEAKQGASSALQEAQNFSEFIAAAAAKLKDVPWWQKIGPSGAWEAIRAMYDAEPAAGADIPTVPEAVNSAVEEARLEREAKIAQWHEESVKYASDREKLEQSILKMRTEAMRLGISKTAIMQREAAMRAEAAKRERTAPADDPTAVMIKRLEKQIALNLEEAKSAETLTATQRQLLEVEFDLADLGDKVSPKRRAEIEALIAKAKAADAAAEAKKKEAKAEEALGRLRDQTAMAEQNRARGNEISLIGMSHGGDAAEMLRRQLDIHRWYEDQVVELRRQAAREKREVTAAEEGELAASLARQLDSERRYQEERRKLMGDWTVGMRKAFYDYVATAADAAGTSNLLFTNAFGGMEEAFVQFVKTGKLEFSSLVDQMIADLARFAYRKMLMGLLGGITGGGGTTGSLLDLMSGSDFGFASGGYTGAGRKNQPAGIVHKGEVVWSQSDVARAGGVGAVEAMRHGMLAAPAPRVVMPATQLNVEVNYHGEGGRVESRIAPDIAGMQRLIIDVWNDNFASGGATAMNIKNRFAVSERV